MADKEKEMTMKPLTIEELKALHVGDCVWIIRCKNRHKERATVESQLNGEAILLSGDIFYCDFIYYYYGITWTAYKNEEMTEVNTT